MAWLLGSSGARACALALGLCALGGCGDDAPSEAPGRDAEMDGSEPADASEDAARDAGADASGDAGADAASDAGADASEDAAIDASADASSDASMPSDPPMSLAETGLYAEGSDGELAEGVMPYAPRYALWSDAADKLRALYLPPGTQIDTSDIDAFVFPVGTKAWKEFSRDGKKLETRLLWKRETGWALLAYAWNEAQTEAILTTRGAQDVLGTTHDIPARTACRECHDGSSDTLLGVSAIQLAHDGTGATLATLQAEGLLTDAPPADIAPDDTLEWNALGYLHANCGNCHNPRGLGFQRVDLDMWLRVGELDAVMSTQSYMTTVDQPLTDSVTGDVLRIAPGAADMSGVITRMRARGTDLAMPPIASEQVDDAGVALIEDWIDTL